LSADAVEDDSIVAVGCVTVSGEITLNYVSPDAKFRGVSAPLLARLEERIASNSPIMATERIISRVSP
jgi:hypothetical protein